MNAKRFMRWTASADFSVMTREIAVPEESGMGDAMSDMGCGNRGPGPKSHVADGTSNCVTNSWLGLEGETYAKG
jgi:hypothetical protein